MKWKSLFIVVALFIAATATVLAQDAASDIPSIVGTITDEGVDFPSEVAAGLTNITFESSREDVSIMPLISRLNDGLTMDDLMGAMSEDEMAAITMLTFYGGVGVAGGESKSYTLNLLPGDYVIILSNISAEGAAEGFATFSVTEGDMADVQEPEADVQLALVDFAFGVPAFISSGPHVWHIDNFGSQWHEASIFKAPEGIESVADVRAAMETNDVEPEQAFYWGPTAPGAEAWVTVDLEPGTYVLMCFLPDLNGDFSPHMAHGMIQVFTVE